MSDAPVQIDVKVDLSLFQQTLGTYADQVPYAAMRAINNVAVDAQTAIRGHIDDVMTIRRKSFINNSVKIKPFATKDTLSATISISPPGGDTRDVLSKFEDGGTKTSLTGGKIAVPVSSDGVIDTSKVIPSAKRPRNLKNSFKITAKNGKQYIFTEIGRGKNRTFKLAYALETSTHIPANLKFVETAIAKVNEVWEDRFNESWNQAVSTAFK